MCDLKLGVLGPFPDCTWSSNLRCVVIADVVPLYMGVWELLARFVEEVACDTFCLAVLGLMIHSLTLSPFLHATATHCLISRNSKVEFVEPRTRCV